MRFKKIIKIFENGNTFVFGLRGTGKDLLFGNVIARRKLKYISNLDYGGDFIPFDYSFIDCGKNTYKNFLEGNLSFYRFPFSYGTDIYLSDCGVYFPAQYCNELNRDYKFIPVYSALSRQLSHNNVHCNTQALSRVWDKLREQSCQYLNCQKCIYIKFLNLVIQRIIIYDKYDSAVNIVKPCRIRKPLFCSKQTRLFYDMYLDNFYNAHGNVKAKTLIYFNRSKHDTYYFEKLLGGDLNEKKDI